MTLSLSLLGSLTATAFPVSRLLAAIPEGIDVVGQSVPGAGGSLGEILAELAGNIRPIFTVVALIMISVAGFRMVVGQEDEASNKAKTTINLCVAGLVLAYLVEPFIAAFFGSEGSVVLSSASAGASVLSDTMLQIISIFAGIAAPLAIATIIFAVIQGIIKGSDEGISLMRTAIFGVAAGLILLLVAEIIADVFAAPGGPGSPSPLIAKAAGIVVYALGYTALLAVAVIIFAGLQLVTSQGEEGQKDKAKNLIIRVLIGLAVILLAMTVVRTIATMLGGTIG